MGPDKKWGGWCNRCGETFYGDVSHNCPSPTSPVEVTEEDTEELT